MAKSPAGNGSLRSRARSGIKNAYRARGHRNNNLWLTYSPKTDRDCLITSDLELVHWLCFLEFSDSVATFQLQPDPLSLPDGHSIRSLHYQALVTYRDGRLELHEVRSSSRAPHDVLELTQAAKLSIGSPTATFRVFDEEKLRAAAPVAVRWLTAISYAAAIRERECHPESTALAVFINRVREGTVRDILEGLVDYDESVVVGVLIRFVIRGSVHVDLSARCLGYSTWWRLYDKVN